MKSYIYTIKYFLLFLLFLIPFLSVFVSWDLYFPYITGKNFAFRSIVELLFFVWLPYIYLFPEYRPRKNLGILLYGLFIGVLFLADMLGVNRSSSLWSNYERMEGFITHIHLFVFTVVLIAMGSREALWKWLFRAHILANLVVIYNIYTSLLDTGKGRLEGSLGNAAYLSIYCAFTIFFVLFLWAKEKSIHIGVRFGYIGIILANLAVLWATQTRGTILGLLTGALVSSLVYVGYYLYERGITKKEYKLVLGGLGALLAIASLLFIFSSEIRDSSVFKNSATIQRLSAISLQEQTVRSRIMIWEMSLKGVQERPLLGWGQENFSYVFAKHYNPEMFDQEQWFDRSHNVFFDWLIAAGAIGLISYLSLFVYLFVTIMKSREVFSKGEISLFIGFLVTYLVHNIFVFDNLISYIGFFTFFAYIVASTSGTTPAAIRKKEKSDKEELSIAFILLVCVSLISCMILLYYVVYLPYAKNKLIVDASNGKIGGASVTLAGYLGAKEKLVTQTLYGNEEAANILLADFAKQVLSSPLDEAEKMQYIRAVSEEFTKRINADRENPRPVVMLAWFAKNINAHALSAELYKIAITRTPNKVLLYEALAQSYISLGKVEEARLAAEEGRALAPRSKEMTFLSASIYLYLQDRNTVLRILQEYILANKAAHTAPSEAYNQAITFLTKNKEEKLAETLADWEARAESGKKI